MAIPRQRYLNPDLPAGVRGWMTSVVRAINDLNTDLQVILLGGITPDNILGTVKTVTWTGTPVEVTTGLRAGASPYGVQILQCLQGSTPVSVGSPAWSSSGDSVVLTGILGTTPGTVYTVTLQILGR